MQINKCGFIPLALLASLSATAFAERPVIDESLYAPGKPPVLAPVADTQKKAAAEEKQQILKSFRDSYKAAGTPRIMILWHRELSDRLSSLNKAVVTVTSTGEAPRDNFQREIKAEWDDGSAKPWLLMAPSLAAEFASGFQATLQSADARLIDRNTVMRLVALDKKGAEVEKEVKWLDSQAVEMAALVKYADYFMTINFLPDPAADGGLQPHVQIVKAATGEIAADVVPRKLYKSDPSDAKWVETEHGFQKVPNNRRDAHWKADERGIVKEIDRINSVEEGELVGLAVMEAFASKLVR